MTLFAARWRAIPNRTVLWVLVFAQIYQLFGAWLLTLPIANSVAASGATNFPGGDAKLFEPGALYLLEVLQREQWQLLAAAGPSVVLLTLWSLGGIIPEWCLLAALSGLPVLPERVRRSYLRAANLAIWCLLTWLVRALCWVLALALAFSLRSKTLSARDERVPDLIFLMILGMGALVQLALSALHDLTAARLVSSTNPIGAGVGHALRVLRGSRLRLSSSYAAVRAAMAVLLIAAEGGVSALRHSGTSEWRLGSCWALHQLALFGALLLRAAWLAYALHAVE
jgi:hypothetical protein